jgi:Ser/Thr protein kinase RdoA (MazF antagonist)
VSDVIEQALALWSLDGATYNLIAARENAVYKVETETQTFALRLHRRGYKTDAEVRSELQWMQAVSSGGIIVPSPVPTRTGTLTETIKNLQVDVLSWVTGTTLDEVLRGSPNRAALFELLGQQMARMHEVSDAWTPPDNFKRCKWDLDGLLGDAPLWDCFWKNPALTHSEKNLFLILREKAQNHLQSLEPELDYGLIHADLVAANVMVDGNAIKIIDFDDGGFGYRLFDIATALLKHSDAADFAALQTALLKGYASVRPIDLDPLDLFMLLRAATYVGWNIKRINEDGAEGRNARFIETTKRLAATYLKF